jgi:hypothetical protein
MEPSREPPDNAMGRIESRRPRLAAGHPMRYIVRPSERRRIAAGDDCGGNVRLACFSSIAALAACGGKREPPASSAASAAHSPGAFTIVATDAGFEAPDHVAAGLRHVVYENHGSQIHEAMFVKLAPGMTARDYVAAVQAGALFPEGARDYSGPGLTSSGRKAEVWLELDPGAYIIICWMGDHAETIPVHELTVGDVRQDDAPPPAPDVVVKLIDFRIELEGDLRAGSQVLRFETVGPSMHEVDLLRLDDGKTLAEFTLWRENQAGPSPGRAGTGILDSHDIRRIVTVREDFDPGHYVLWCEMPMNTDPAAPHVDATHFDAGMVREVTIAP